MYLWQILSLAAPVLAHSWIDTIYATSNPGTLGYPRNYAGHDADTSITEYKVLTRDATLPACGPSQRTATYSSQFPMLQVSAGSEITATYQENGHVTKDKLPPDYLPHPGNYSWYISARSGALTTFGDLKEASQLSGPSSFDDGRCAVDAAGIQGRQGPIDCLSKITIPSTLTAGQYQLVWWWDFTKLTEIDPTYTEYYTTCLDIEVLSSSSSSAVAGQILQAAVLPSSTPRYANTSFTPAGYASEPVATAAVAAAAVTLPVEHDVVVVTAQESVITSTYLYEHPVATLQSITTSSPVSSAAMTSASTDYLATMYVDPANGSLRPFNLIADVNGILQEVQVTVPMSASTTTSGPMSAPAEASTSTSIESSAALEYVHVGSAAATSIETIEEIVTIYVPTYITIDEPCASTLTTMPQSTSASVELHTTITMTTTVTVD